MACNLRSSASFFVQCSRQRALGRERKQEFCPYFEYCTHIHTEIYKHPGTTVLEFSAPNNLSLSHSLARSLALTQPAAVEKFPALSVFRGH